MGGMGVVPREHCVFRSVQKSFQAGIYMHGNVCALVRATSCQKVHPTVSSAVTFSPFSWQ